MPEAKKHSFAELRAYFKEFPIVVPSVGSKADLDLSALDCEDFLMIITLAEFSNIDLSKYWKYHDENCECELSLKNIEPLT